VSCGLVLTGIKKSFARFGFSLIRTLFTDCYILIFSAYRQPVVPDLL
jgi:hypothetical protein